MLDDSIIIEYLKENIDEKRLIHSQETAREAVKLSKIHGADAMKAHVAGLLHDVAKGKCHHGLKKYADLYGVDIDDIEAKNVELIHGKLGAAMVKEQLGIDDKDILSAIRWHTTGRSDMSLLEKVIYLADLIEPGRNFEGIDTIRHMAYRDIDQAMLMALKQVMLFVQTKGFALHPNSLQAYNYYIRRKNINLMHQFNDDVLDISRQLFMKKAEDVRALHVSHLTIVADYFILASGRSDVHVRSLCDDVEKIMLEKGRQRLRIEGYREGRWIVLDYGDILIHIFHKTEREFYGLERLWLDGDNSLIITEEDVKPKE